jgi:hypothetical protein
MINFTKQRNSCEVARTQYLQRQTSEGRNNKIQNLKPLLHENYHLYGFKIG